MFYAVGDSCCIVLSSCNKESFLVLICLKFSLFQIFRADLVSLSFSWAWYVEDPLVGFN